MFPIKHSESQYIVAFDDLDLTFLRQYVVKSTGECRVLWSRSALDGESEYYEVELESEEDECDSSYIESFESIICHICNINVPQPFFLQHCRSVMHNNYKRLTDIVLKNVSKQLSIDTENANTNNQNDVFYCETCSKVVLVKDKRKHNKTAYHLQCKKNVKQVEEFLVLYTKNQSTTDFDNKAQSLITTDDINKNYIDSEYNTASNSDLSECDSETYNTDHEEPSVNKYKTVYSNDGRTEDVNQHKAKDVPPKKSLQFNLDDFVSIETPKGYREKVKLRDFHGYSEHCNVLYCKLCDKLLLKEHLQEHNKITMHVANITQPINDEFIRDLVDERSHCILCNKIVYPNTNHETDLFHKMLVANILPDKIVPEMNPKQTFCDVCNKYIDTHNYLGHTKGQKHKTAVMNIKSNKSEERVTPANAVTTSNTIEDKENYCEICQTHVPKDSMKIHESQKSHVDNLLKVLVTYLINDRNETANASTSSSIVSEDNFKQAPTTSKAMVAPTTSKAMVAPTTSKAMVAPTTSKAMVAPTTSKAMVAPTTSKAMVAPTTSKAMVAPTTSKAMVAPTTSKAMIAPTASKKEHTDMTKPEKLIEYKKQMIESNATQMKCLVCDSNIPNSDNNIIQHVEGYNHTENLKDLLSIHKIKKITSKFYYCGYCDMNTNDFIAHINVYVGHIKESMNIDSIYKDQLIEYVHLDPLNNTSLAIYYRELHSNLLRKNKIIVKVEGSIYYCNVCLIKLTRISEIDHMFGERHASCLSNKK